MNITMNKNGRFSMLMKGDLTIALDRDYLANQRTRLLNEMESDEFDLYTNKKGSYLTKEDYELAVDRLVNLALNIIENKLGIDIFEYLPLTKDGNFHKTSSTLLATSGIKDVWNGLDYFSMHFMDLRLVPVSFEEKTNPFYAISQTGNLFGNISGDGKYAYIEMDWFSRKNDEIPIFDGSDTPKKVEKVRNKYLKYNDLKVGYTYLDAKGNEFLYLGQLYTDSVRCLDSDGKVLYANQEDYLNSKKRAELIETRKEYEQYYKYKGGFFYMKMTKKNEALVNASKNIGELLGKIIEVEHWDWSKKFKHLTNPMKVVSESRQVIDADLGDGFYTAEWEYDNGYKKEMLKYFYYIEKAE